jgi:hypothetical protein
MRAVTYFCSAAVPCETGMSRFALGVAPAAPQPIGCNWPVGVAGGERVIALIGASTKVVVVPLAGSSLGSVKTPMQSFSGQFKERDTHSCFNPIDLLLIVTSDERGMKQGGAPHGPVC